jgi:hypothetical protein
MNDAHLRICSSPEWASYVADATFADRLSAAGFTNPVVEQSGDRFRFAALAGRQEHLQALGPTRAGPDPAPLPGRGRDNLVCHYRFQVGEVGCWSGRARGALSALSAVAVMIST